MLDVRLDRVSLRCLRDVTFTFAASTHTAIVGPPASGISTLLRVIAGIERLESGSIHIGSRDVTGLRSDRRPLLYATASLDVPGRWSVEHALVNAVRSRTLDLVDRRHELALAVEKWRLEPARRIDTLSDSERARVHLARIEMRKPAIVVADKLLRDLSSAAADWYRTLRVLGTTVISAPASPRELGMTDRVVVLDGGRVVQEGTAAHVYGSPQSAAAAGATGEVNQVPIVVHGRSVESPIGAWDLAGEPPFQGEGTALIRPEAFTPALPDEESDLIFGIEEAAFDNGRWMADGLLSGGVTLRVSLPATEKIFKGRLLALRYDPSSFTLLPV